MAHAILSGYHLVTFEKELQTAYAKEGGEKEAEVK